MRVIVERPFDDEQKRFRVYIVLQQLFRIQNTDVYADLLKWELDEKDADVVHFWKDERISKDKRGSYISRGVFLKNIDDALVEFKKVLEGLVIKGGHADGPVNYPPKR